MEDKKLRKNYDLNAERKRSVAELTSQIRGLKKEIRSLQRIKDQDEEQIEKIKKRLDNLLTRYSTLTEGKKYIETKQELAEDFCEEYFYVLAENRTERALKKLYNYESSQYIMGTGYLDGRDAILASILGKFADLKITVEILKVKAEEFPPQGVRLYFTCYSTIKIDNDTPRKVIHIFQLNKSKESGLVPLAITKEQFCVTDTRPLFHWPEREIPKTKHDNWEPQFKPSKEQIAAEREAYIARKNKRKEALTVEVKVEEVVEEQSLVGDEGSVAEGSIEESVGQEEELDSVGDS